VLDKEDAGASPPAQEEAIGDGEKVDKIRDILFGNQMRDYERKFSRLEERIMTEVGRVREESSQRLEALERYLNTELESLSERLKGEQDGRLDAQRGLADELARTGEQLGKRLGELDDRFGSTARDLRQQILEQSKSLTEEMGVRYAQLREALDHAAEDLHEQKVDRAALSGLLTELALRLSDDSLPDSRGEE